MYITMLHKKEEEQQVLIGKLIVCNSVKVIKKLMFLCVLIRICIFYFRI